MADDPPDKTPRGPLHALSRWLKRAAPSPAPGFDLLTPDPGHLPARIGHYKVTGKLGQGGMGVVYAARDERLGRSVALKTMTSFGRDETARKRFWREARAAAAVNHPNVCQLYEIGEEGDELFLAMELLRGEPLSERIGRGAMSVSEALPIGQGILAALAALHAHGIVHRDLKPSNVYLTSHGVKVLDFGLAKSNDPDLARALGSIADLTRSGVVVGTPHYMAPEQIRGEPLDARCDLFAAGAILFEMLVGRPPFDGPGVVEILHAGLHEQPPALAGPPAVAALDRVIRHALAKRADDRPSSAMAMAEELRAVEAPARDEEPGLARALTRLVVLPFRILRPDPETDFLAFSLADAIATSLSRFGSLVVRSSAVASRFGGDTPDLRALAAEADVDRVVMGTLLRAGDRLQATAQLVEAPGGTLLTSHAVLSSLGDLFLLQDDIVRRVVETLSLPLVAGGSPPTPAAPRDAGAYELYLRANALARSYEELPQARELYRRCLELDPNFAPAWARLGRCHWVIGKYVDGSGNAAARAEEALLRALEIDPRLAVAHKVYANVEADSGQGVRALARLLEQAGAQGNDPELFAGIVHASRYCGLYAESIAAHREARRLDPNVPTSVAQTVMMTGDVERLMALEQPSGAGGGDMGIRVIGLGLAGRRDEALRQLAGMRRETRVPAFRPWVEFLEAWLERRPDDMVAIRSTFPAVGIMNDPEAIFQEGWLYCDAGAPERGLELLGRAVERGYFVAPTLAASPSFDALRDVPAFREVHACAEEGRERARVAFRDGGGDLRLGG
jgi:serine/threonine protein kinase/tetratricopeptide (TPR) repeat protein